jgi:hypothetical protein
MKESADMEFGHQKQAGWTGKLNQKSNANLFALNLLASSNKPPCFFT